MTTETFNTIDIEVMKSELLELRNDVHQIGTKMDVIIQMQVSITQLQERYDTQRSALDRAFTALKENRNTAEETSAELQRVMSFIKGGTLIGVLLFSFAQWYVLQQIEKLERTAEAFITVDRRLTFIESRIWPDSRTTIDLNKK
ncbi:hypothetical protein D3C79_622870 [compost metagenome]